MQNHKGFTLIEVLATIVISVMILGVILFAFQYTNSQSKRISDLEQIRQESVQMTNHIINTLRKTDQDISDTTAGYVLTMTTKSNANEYTKYSYNPTTHEFAVSQQVIDDPNADPVTYRQFDFVLSTHVTAIDFTLHPEDAGDPDSSVRSIDISLTLTSDSGNVHTYETTVYVPQL